ncbi:MAG TPA: hypothetical protein VKB51_06765 [bacterium]|nr:hypothetical protein [bacterium]
MKRFAAVLAGAAVAALALVLMAACQPVTHEPPATLATDTVQEQGSYVPGLGTFSCLTPHHVCPTRFEPDVRAKACTCQGEPGRFQYHRGAP